MFGNVFTFGYDGDGRIMRTVRLAQRADSIVETLAYDSLSRLVRRHIQGGATVIHDDSLLYDSRGYLGGNARTGDGIGYDGLGHMTTVFYNGRTEQCTYDARGNQTAATTYGAGYSQSYYSYAPHSDRLVQAVHPTSTVWDTTYYIIDRDGAVGEEITHHYFELFGGCDLCGGTYVEQRDIINTYDLARRLIGSRFRLDTLNYHAPNYQPYSRNETYRYDALERRVWQQMVRDSNCVKHDANSGCRNTVSRTIWDGNQILYETREALDTAQRIEGEPTNDTYYGVVGYTHAMGIDAPVDLFKGGTVVIPYTDWRGKYDKGTCPATFCVQPAILFPGADMSSYGDAMPTGYVCHTTAGGTVTGGMVCEPPSWFGSIIMEMQDGSGYQYRRNRYVL
ncbi:MAG: hypothetical protein IRY91_01720 [Gemmatimonadaceae bacterium]|nr:hypothetical protein [Gemmatimonadaceae bacterium]